jgi:Transposase DDE domain/Transposase domain (DUF772)
MFVGGVELTITVVVVRRQALRKTNPRMNSLLQVLNAFSNLLQRRLFPALEEEIGPLSQKHQSLVEILALLEMDRFAEVRPGRRGRPAHSRANILRAFVAKAVFGIPHTRGLIDRLKSDTTLLRLCGWQHVAEIPDETVFSRAFCEFAGQQLPQRVHEALIQRHYADQLVGHISRDATAVPAREKAAPKPQTPKRRASRRQDRTPEQMTRVERQCWPDTTLEHMLAELPRLCDKGCKKDSKGLPQYWIGYKLHLDVADGQVPISAVLTSASLHDSQAAIPLAHMTAQRVTSLYDLMDCAYDSQHIRQYSHQLGHVPIIDPLRRAGQPKAPLAPHQQTRFRERTTAERAYSRLKDEFGGRFVRVRGHVKVMAHLMFGVLALTVDQLLRLART